MDITEATIKTCKTCLATNLIEEIKIARCKKCTQIYCIHFASNIDPAFCTDCLSEVSLVRETITKTYEHYDEETDTTHSYKKKAKSIRLEGLDWLFSQRKISTLSEDELELAIEYHRALLNGMLKEREERRTAHAHRYAQTKFDLTPASTTATTETATTVKRTRTIASSKTQANAAGILQSLLASGKSPQEIMAMLAKQGGK